MYAIRSYYVHKVQNKDTLVSLAEEYNTPVAILKEMNGLRGDSLVITSYSIHYTKLYELDGEKAG